MPDTAETPMYYANFVTSMLTVDDLVMEFRRVDRPHRDHLSQAAAPAPFTAVPPITAAEILAREPVARVSLTFSAAKSLKEYLDNALPRIEESRRTGKPL